MKLAYGDIVIVRDILDPRGENPKDRPAVIVTPTDEIEAAGTVFVIAMTTTVPRILPDDHVALPWQRPRHPRTGLNQRNAAVCRWLDEVNLDRIERIIGIVPTPELAQVEEILRRLANDS